MFLFYNSSQREIIMKYLLQFMIILIFVFLGEVCEYFIPLPIAGSIYGLLLLFIALCLHIVKLNWVSNVADWFHSVMALFFIAPAVAVIDIWPEIADIWFYLIILLVVAYFVTMVITGKTADYFLNIKKSKKTKKKRSNKKKRNKK